MTAVVVFVDTGPDFVDGISKAHTVIHTAKGSSHKNEQGEVVVDEKPQPAIYAIVPLAVAADTVLLPVYGVTAIIVLTIMATGGWPRC